MARKSRRKKAKAGAQQTSSGANAERLTLLGLPVEIRSIILRMVVGDQLVLPPRQYTTDLKQQLGFEVFAINRQLYREACPLFWRTSRICFAGAWDLDIFLDRLTDSQKTNLRNISLDVRCRSKGSQASDYEEVYWHVRQYWQSCELKRAETHPLRFLESVELRLRLDYHSSGEPPARQLETIHAALRALANLRFARLKHAQVSIVLKDKDLGYNAVGESLTTEELAAIAADFQVTLLNPVVTKEDHTRFLTNEVHDLKWSLTKTEIAYKTNMRYFKKLQKQADDVRVEADEIREKADKIKERLSTVEAALQNYEEATSAEVVTR